MGQLEKVCLYKYHGKLFRASRSNLNANDSLWRFFDSSIFSQLILIKSGWRRLCKDQRSKGDSPGAKNCSQRKEAAVGDGGTARVASVDGPIQKRANVRVAFQQQDGSVSRQLRNLRAKIHVFLYFVRQIYFCRFIS